MDKTKVLAALTSLSNRSRLDIVQLLAQSGPEGLRPQEIKRLLAMIHNSALSGNLNNLRISGLIIKSGRKGGAIYYTLNPKTLNEVVAYLIKNCLPP